MIEHDKMPTSTLLIAVLSLISACWTASLDMHGGGAISLLYRRTAPYSDSGDDGDGSEKKGVGYAARPNGLSSFGRNRPIRTLAGSILQHRRLSSPTTIHFEASKDVFSRPSEQYGTYWAIPSSPVSYELAKERTGLATMGLHTEESSNSSSGSVADAEERARRPAADAAAATGPAGAVRQRQRSGSRFAPHQSALC